MTMIGLNWIVTIIVGGLAGWIAEKVIKADHGLLMNIMLGVLGALILNSLLINLTGRAYGGIPGQFITAVIGACILIYGYRVVKKAHG